MPKQKMEAAASVQQKDKMVDGAGPPPPPASALWLIFWFFNKNYGRGTKTIFLWEVIRPMLSPKKQEKSIA